MVFNLLLPFLTMGVMNYLIYRAMNRSHLLTRASITTFRSTNPKHLVHQNAGGGGGGGGYGRNSRAGLAGGGGGNQRMTLPRRASSLLLSKLFATLIVWISMEKIMYKQGLTQGQPRDNWCGT